MRISDWSSDVCSSVLLVARRQQGSMPETGLVLQLKVETSGIAQFRDGRRGEGKDARLLDAGEIAHGATGNGTDLLRRFRPQAPVLQLDEHHRRILARTEEHTSELQSLMTTSYA